MNLSQLIAGSAVATTGVLTRGVRSGQTSAFQRSEQSTRVVEGRCISNGVVLNACLRHDQSAGVPPEVKLSQMVGEPVGNRLIRRRRPLVQKRWTMVSTWTQSTEPPAYQCSGGCLAASPSAPSAASPGHWACRCRALRQCRSVTPVAYALTTEQCRRLEPQAAASRDYSVAPAPRGGHQSGASSLAARGRLPPRGV